MEELRRIRQPQITVGSRSTNAEKRRTKSSAEAQAGERLIQRVISAARLAFENSKSCQERQPKHVHEQRHAFENKSQLNDAQLAQKDLPEIYVENDIDGLCYIAGPRRRSLRDDIDNNNNNNNDEIQKIKR